jgi:aryl-alcohol dehydrogenase-like predicted oxidoreductase
VIDCAANHGAGAASTLVGHALRAAFTRGIMRRDGVFVCSKAGFTEHLSPVERARLRRMGVLDARLGADAEHAVNPEYLEWELEQQCRLLGLEALDAFLLQNPEEALGDGRERFRTLVRRSFAALERAVDRGRIAMYGVSVAEAFSSPRNDPAAIDLGALLSWAHELRGDDHHFRVIEVPLNPALTGALRVESHTSGGHLRTCVQLAMEQDLLVFASAGLNGGVGLEALAKQVESELPDPAMRVLDATRSLPGVTVALVGATSKAHVESALRVLHHRP